MAQVPSVPKYIQEPEVQFRAPDSEATMFKIAGSINFILDNHVVWPGRIEIFGGPESAVPAGYFPCDGREISRTTYANLFAAIGERWGSGNGVTTFNVPDLRGTFLRMVDETTVGAAGRDPEAAFRTPYGDGLPGDVGSYQQDQFRSHTHATPFPAGGVGNVYQDSGDSGDGQQSGATGGAETRPKNAYVMCMIKW